MALTAAFTGPATALSGVVGEWTGAITMSFALTDQAVVANGVTPRSPAIAIGRKADGLAFLHYCLTDRQPEPTWGFVEPLGKADSNLLGNYHVTFGDGSSEMVEIRYGDNITRPDLTYGEDVASCPFWAQPAWEGRDREGRRVTLWAHEWVNPCPDKEIARVSVFYTGTDPQEQIALLGLTALTPR